MSTLNTNPWAVAVSGSPTPARTRLQGSPQQEAFWAGLLDESAGNLLLDARAGTGKSTSCREGMWRLMERGGSPRIRYCCFNKAIAVNPGHVIAQFNKSIVLEHDRNDRAGALAALRDLAARNPNAVLPGGRSVTQAIKDLGGQ